MKASLRSNDGDSEFSILPLSECKYAGEPGYQCTVTLNSNYWDGDHPHPIHFELDGIWLNTRHIANFRTAIYNWIHSPLSELKASELKGSFQLASLDNQSCEIIFGPRPDVIDSGHLTISWNVKAGRIGANFHFVTDQSCLKIFADDLAKISS